MLEQKKRACIYSDKDIKVRLQHIQVSACIEGYLSHGEPLSGYPRVIVSRP